MVLKIGLKQPYLLLYYLHISIPTELYIYIYSTTIKSSHLLDTYTLIYEAQIQILIGAICQDDTSIFALICSKKPHGMDRVQMFTNCINYRRINNFK